METRRDVFQAIADPTRRAILDLLSRNAMTPGALAEHFDSTRQTISKHIRILHECELLNQQQTGREYHYHLNPVKMKPVAAWIEPYRKMWEGRLDAMSILLEEIQNDKKKKKNKNLTKKKKK
jgi:DNA-binding transcriptional ArsR family regulator